MVHIYYIKSSEQHTCSSLRKLRSFALTHNPSCKGKGDGLNRLFAD